MSKTDSFEQPEVNLVATLEEAKAHLDSDSPFLIALLGDWSGRTNKSDSSELRPLLVDRDSLDEVMRKLDVRLRLSPSGDDGSVITLSFKELGDFHPDRIFERLEIFDALKETRKRLNNPATFAAAARDVSRWAEGAKNAEPSESTKKAPEPFRSNIDGSALLDEIIGEAAVESRPRGTSTAPDDMQRMLQRLVEPHLSPAEDPRQAELVSAVDEATSSLMRSILHHPEFQSLESAWRALDFLVSRLETSSELKIYLYDISREELVTDLLSARDERTSSLYKEFAEQPAAPAEDATWAILAGNYTFDQTNEDIELLNRLARIAGKSGAAFLSAASSRLLGCESLAATPDPDDWHLSGNSGGAAAWQALRLEPQASSVGLALPQFLLRLPYGKDTDPIEQFDFEETTGAHAHDDYLWGNPSFACVYLLAQAFSAAGWDMRAGDFQEIDGLPLHVFEKDGESQAKPCAEVLLSLRAAEAILNKGLMPLLTMKGTDTIRLAMFQSIADPPTPLVGTWE